MGTSQGWTVILSGLVTIALTFLLQWFAEWRNRKRLALGDKKLKEDTKKVAAETENLEDTIPQNVIKGWQDIADKATNTATAAILRADNAAAASIAMTNRIHDLERTIEENRLEFQHKMEDNTACLDKEQQDMKADYETKIGELQNQITELKGNFEHSERLHAAEIEAKDDTIRKEQHYIERLLSQFRMLDISPVDRTPTLPRKKKGEENKPPPSS